MVDNALKYIKDSMKSKPNACHCGNILDTGKKYCSPKCYQTRNLKFDPALAFTSLPYSDKYYYGAMKWGYVSGAAREYYQWDSDRNRQHADQKWGYDYPEPARSPLNFHAENTLVAHMIQEMANDANLEIEVLLSGGLDSIVVADTFREAEIPFTPITWRFTNGKNEHDIKHAITYCEKYGLEQKFIDIDIEDFFYNKILDYSMPIQTISPGRAIMCYIIDQLDGFPVFGGGEPFAYFDYNQKLGMNCVMTSEGEPMQYIEKWLTYRDRPGCGRFFRMTTEQTLSGILSESFWKVIVFMEEIGDQLPFFSNVYGHPRNKKRRETESSQAKHNAYKKHYPHLDTFRSPIEHEWQGPEAGLIKKTTAYTGYEYLEKEFRIANWIQMKMFPLTIFQHYYDEPVIKRIDHLLGNSGVISRAKLFQLNEEIKNARKDNTKAERIKRHAGL